jgi:hypothetical protein
MARACDDGRFGFIVTRAVDVSSQGWQPNDADCLRPQKPYRLPQVNSPPKRSRSLTANSSNILMILPHCYLPFVSEHPEAFGTMPKHN